MKIQFYGAAGVVTGSRTLLTDGATRLLVDCGMFQGHKKNRLRNWEELDVGRLDAVVLTHGHIDHSGWVPALIARGYDGPVYCTEGTADLLQILWPDAGRIQEEDAKHANHRKSTRHEPALAMFTEADAVAALRQVKPIAFDTDFELGSLTLSFRVAGHILGAAAVWIRSPQRSILFSGDVGRPADLVMPPPEPPPAVDVVVMESTYGQRVHPESDLLESLAQVVDRTLERGGMLLIPSFAVGRTQGLLLALHRLMEGGRIPRLPIVVDSPMATRATRALVKHPGGSRLSVDELHAMCEHVQFVSSVEESKALHARTEPFILISASGMLTGGRVLHHLEHRAPVNRNTLLFVGFQAPGTRGAGLVAGQSPVKIYGKKIKVRCEVTEIRGLSAHADAKELTAWLESAPSRPKRVFLNHGEPDAADALRQRLKALGHSVTIATEGLAWDLTDLKPLPVVRQVDAPPPAAMLAHATGFRFSSLDDLATVQWVLGAIGRGDMPKVPIAIDDAQLAERLRSTLSDADLALLD